MSKGLAGVREIVKQREARQSQYSGASTNWFRLKNVGDSATVRFLEQGEDVHWIYTHELPPTDKMKWGYQTPCLDQDGDGAPCPGCEQGLKRKFAGYINLIWRDAPVWKKTAEGYLAKDGSGNLIQEGVKDQVAVWNSGITVFEELDGKDATYKGLCSRDFVIVRKGVGLKTKWSIEPADVDSGPVPMSGEDEELAHEKYDLTTLTQPLDYDDFKQKLMVGGGQEEERDPSDDVNPFFRKRD